MDNNQNGISLAFAFLLPEGRANAWEILSNNFVFGSASNAVSQMAEIYVHMTINDEIPSHRMAEQFSAQRLCAVGVP